ncbi:MAG: CrpP family ICE-associated protein [Pseudomonas oryzihabitans]|nr:MULTISPECIES: CrpP family ICE-associated protein [Pseudomonas]MBA1256938.1 CrpP family protein [Pseudomonas psychrotolerans]MDU4058900.1 CrpP family ICE-associated protein [Pseudomonas oryzihabitans]
MRRTPEQCARGTEAARAQAAVHVCPYRHPGLRTSWLRGYAQAQQQTFDF